MRTDLGNRNPSERLGAKSFASFSSASRDDKATPLGAHSGPEAMGLLPFAIIGLKCALHSFLSLLSKV